MFVRERVLQFAFKRIHRLKARLARVSEKRKMVAERPIMDIDRPLWSMPMMVKLQFKIHSI